ncbi:hypothetical protein SPRG_06403 [Saprolegnia parasitica CBS 223.65]|uniref:DH domain-containing protein n=1 Tax=Saprolegnia parasitica (strain CBS 223.65) TaxID=695850 RepID=A0A067CCQ1_SAPPC|nr:hypothetical protein SPRG_06403 [Saprolegnia parasitica CBS 223.65]KDO28544.1 hypothetical protein SPRG_06403 [Saprolegnia parasitica CBS 223.65]|eukprot:XP_012200610.1 hypothetical protein SPRG_06403 [Saprolegnia parasitica CBS 223.65]
MTLRLPNFLSGHKWKRTDDEPRVSTVSSSASSASMTSSRRLSQLQLLSGHPIRLDSFRRQHPDLQAEASYTKCPRRDTRDSDDDLMPLDLWEDTTPHPSVQCYAVLHEFVATELAYFDALEAMKRVFDKVFHVAFDHPALTTLYATTMSLHALHGEFVASLPTLADRVHDHVLEAHSRAIMQALRRRLPFFKLYSHYCSAYKEVTTLLQVRPVTRVAPECQAFVVQLCHASRSLQVDMQSEMIKPVQRLCRYPLLIREWLAFAPPSLAGALQDLLLDVKNVAALVNERVRAEQNNLKLFELRARLVGPQCPELCLPTRHLLGDVHLHVVSTMSLAPWGFWVARPRTLIVLSDMLLVAKPMRKQRAKVRKQFAWSQLALDEIDVQKHPSWDANTSFLLRAQRFDGQWYTMLLKCATAKGKREVLTLLRSAMAQHVKQTPLATPAYASVSAV